MEEKSVRTAPDFGRMVAKLARRASDFARALSESARVASELVRMAPDSARMAPDSAHVLPLQWVGLLFKLFALSIGDYPKEPECAEAAFRLQA